MTTKRTQLVKVCGAVLCALVMGFLVGRASDHEATTQYPPNCTVYEDGSARCHVDR